MELSEGELILRIAGAALLGGLIGVEREISDQPAGFRTHILVSLGSALFTIVGAYGVGGFLEETAVRFDPTRIAAQIVTGIGFLGAGVIIQRGITIRGLTTAASLWLTAAVGTAVGFGYWLGAAVTAFAAVLALYGLKLVERRMLFRLKRGRSRYVVDAHAQLTLESLVNAVEAFDGRIESMKVMGEGEGERRLVLVVLLPSGSRPEQLARRLVELDGVDDVDWSS
jgi:putative Mg2+ transporter-C (MgtC) family protein